MKKLISFVLVAVLALGLFGCGAKTEAPATTAPAATEATTAATVAETVAETAGSDNWKVAVLTGTVSQGEE